jgi:hypothetical protein
MEIRSDLNQNRRLGALAALAVLGALGVVDALGALSVCAQGVRHRRCSGNVE